MELVPQNLREPVKALYSGVRKKQDDALITLLNQPHISVLPHVIRFYKNDVYASYTMNAGSLVRKIVQENYDEAFQLLVKHSARSPYLAVTAADALLRVGDTQAIPFFSSLLHNKQFALQMCAIRNLNHTMHFDALLPLTKYFVKQRDFKLIKSVAEILSKISAETLKGKNVGLGHPLFALTLVNPSRHPFSFMKLVLALKKPANAKMNEQAWRLYAQELKSIEKVLK